ncbi:MAG: PAS domain-containing protein [Campylobacterota bacterium]|nr:PAS domain-containing protein [Campylobacterota bacterium]
MKTHNLKYTDDKELNNFVSSNGIDNSRNILIQIFSGVVDEDILWNLSKYINELLPSSHIIGTTTSGEIFEGSMCDEQIIISFSVFDNTIVNSAICELETKINIENILDSLITDDTKALIVFSDGLKSNGEEVIKEISRLKPDIIVSGGRAGDNNKFCKTLIFNENSVLESGCIIASLSSKNLIVHNNYMLNWQTIGQDMIVTKSNGNCICEINNIKTVDIYKKYLGVEIADELPMSGIEFPLVFEKGGVQIARAPVAVLDQGSLIFAGNIEVGTKVKFGFGDVELINDESYKTYNRLKVLPIESTFIYSCSARKALIGADLEVEFGLLQNIAPTVGYFTYGEYFHNKTTNDLLNITTTLLSLSEKDELPTITEEKKDYTKTNRTLTALTNLVKVTSEELINTSNKLNEAQEIASIGSWDWDITNSTLLWSNETYNIFNVNKDEFEASYETFLSYVHCDDREFVNDAVFRSLEDKNIPYDIEHRLVLDDGTVKFVRELGKIFRDEDDKPVRISGIVQDITKEKHSAQLILDQTKEQNTLLSLFDKADSVLFKWNNDENWSVSHVSQSVTKLLGYTQEEFVCGEIVYVNCIHKDDLDYAIEEVAQASNTKKDYFKHKPYRLNAKDGTIKWVLDYTVILRDEQGGITHYIGYINDITQEKETEKLIAEQSKLVAMGEMIGNIAHQWRQPLSTISATATGMQVQKDIDILTDELFNKGCDSINKTAIYLSKTIDDFRDFIKGDRKQHEFNLKDNIDSFIHLVEGNIKNNDINLLLDIQDDITINGYPNELLQCFINIFNNSKDELIKLQSDRYFTISASLIDDKVQIIFKDNAGGIPEDVLPHLFEPYFTTKHKSQGTGLGLSMTYNLIVEGMRGTIKANNSLFKYKESESIGAEFVITLPLS